MTYFNECEWGEVMKLKNKIFTLIILLFVIFSVDNVRAVSYPGGVDSGVDHSDTDGLANDGIGSGHGTCPNGLCTYNNGNEMAVEVKLAYVDNSGMDTYHTEVWTNNPSANGTITANGNRMVYKDFLPSGGSNYEAMASAIDSYFLGNNGANANAWYNAYADTILATQDANAINAAQYGTRIISTPVLGFIDHGKSNTYLTVKEVAARYNELTNKGRFEAIAKLFMTEYNDVGIMQGGVLNPLFVANLFSGYGYNIIDFMKFIGYRPNQVVKPQPSCPGGSMNLSNPNSNCTESLGGNTYTYSYTASGGGKANVHRQYGEDQNAAGTGAYCKLYCQEYGTAVLPGALGTSVQLGSYIVWPTAETNETSKFTKNMYPLKFSGRKECKLVLMPDKGNFPGQGCLQDPVAEYECLYDGTRVAGSKYACTISRSDSISVVGTKKDHFNYTYEQVRISNGQYFNKEAYCGAPAYANGVATCPEGQWSKYKLDPVGNTHYNEVVYGLYNRVVTNITQQAETTANACKLEISLRPCAKLPYYETVYEYGPSGIVTGSHQERTCHFDYDNAVVAYKAAQSTYKTLENEINEIKGNITTCKMYIKNFNWARDILNEIGLCGNFSANASDYYHFQTSASMSYQSCGKEYSVGGNLSKENDVTYSCEGQCGGLGFQLKPDYLTLQSLDTSGRLDGKVAQIQGRNINFVTNEVKYTTNSDYSYVNKKANKYSTSKLNSNFLEIFTRNNSLAKVLPTDYSCSINDISGNAISYDLEINNASFGENSRFKIKSESGNNYVCKYTVSKKNDGCECPQDTEMAGKDLMYYVANDPVSCADAQVKYCSSGEEQPFNDLYCPNMDNPIPLTSCLKTGIGYNRCVQLVCTDEYKCKNTNGLRTGMDITDCVQTRMAQGSTLNQALDYCDSVVCPIGKFIIYRTIRLENPFPGKEISKIAPGFNNDVIGRYPGSNWNGKELVKKKIRNNRTTSGTTIYNKKEPLYTFVLDGVKINEIREYNKKQKDGYNDFTLECKKKNSSGCISYVFVHNSNLSGLTGGTCQNISLDNGFYTCDD